MPLPRALPKDYKKPKMEKAILDDPFDELKNSLPKRSKK